MAFTVTAATPSYISPSNSDNVCTLYSNLVNSQDGFKYHYKLYLGVTTGGTIVYSGRQFPAPSGYGTIDFQPILNTYSTGITNYITTTNITTNDEVFKYWFICMETYGSGSTITSGASYNSGQKYSIYGNYEHRNINALTETWDYTDYVINSPTSKFLNTWVGERPAAITQSGTLTALNQFTNTTNLNNHLMICVDGTHYYALANSYVANPLAMKVEVPAFPVNLNGGMSIWDYTASAYTSNDIITSSNSSYQLWFVSANTFIASADTVQTKMSEVITFNITPTSGLGATCNRYNNGTNGGIEVYWKDALGGMESYIFAGKLNHIVNAQKNYYVSKTLSSYKSVYTKQLYDINKVDEYELESGFMDKQTADNVATILMSKYVWAKIGGEVIPIYITTDKISTKNDKDKILYQIIISFEAARIKNKIN